MLQLEHLDYEDKLLADFEVTNKRFARATILAALTASNSQRRSFSNCFVRCTGNGGIVRIVIFHAHILKHYVKSVIFIDVGSREEFGKVSLARGHKKVGNP